MSASARTPWPANAGARRLRRCLSRIRSEQQSKHWTREQLVANYRIKLLPSILDQLRTNLRLTQSLSVGAIRGHRINGISEQHDARSERDCLAVEPVRIAGAIPILMVMLHGRDNIFQMRNGRN